MYSHHFSRETASGIICPRWRTWDWEINVNALNDARSAVNMEPDNMQYQMLLQRLEGGGTWYQEQQNPFGGMPSDGSDYCMKLCLAKSGM